MNYFQVFPAKIQAALDAIKVQADLRHRLTGHAPPIDARDAALRYFTHTYCHLEAALWRAVEKGDLLYPNVTPRLDRLRDELVRDVYDRAELGRCREVGSIWSYHSTFERLARQALEAEALEEGSEWRAVLEKRVELATNYASLAAGRKLPLDLAARHTAARTTAEIAWLKAKADRTRSDDHRRLIDVRVVGDVIEFARCWLEAAKRRLVHRSEAARLVDDELGIVVRRRLSEIVPDGLVLDSDAREAEKRVRESSEWDAYLTELLNLPEPLAADSAAREVERRPDGSHPGTEDPSPVPSIPGVDSKRPSETTNTPRSAALEARKERRHQWIKDHCDEQGLDRVGFARSCRLSDTAVYAVINDSPGRFGPKARKRLLKVLRKSPEEWDRL